MSEYFSGRVESVVYANEPSNFYILKIALDGKQKPANVITAKGSIPGMKIKPGVWFGFEGNWTRHSKYGRQISITKAPVVKGQWDAETALNLMIGHGVGRLLAENLYEHFGEQLVDILDLQDEEECVKKLQEVKDVTEFAARHTHSRWISVRSMFSALEFLGQLNLPKNKVDQIYSHFGPDTSKILTKDPWSLVRVDGVSFEQADEVAQKLGLQSMVDQRLRGAVIYALKERRGMGHVFLTVPDIVNAVSSSVTGVQPPQIAKAIKQLHEDCLLTVDNKTRKGTTAIYEPWFHEVEHGSAVLLSEREKTASMEDADQYDSYMKALGKVGPKTLELASNPDTPFREVAQSAVFEWASVGKLILSKDQMEGATNALIHPVSILTGLPGTGKTTTLKVVVRVLLDAGIEPLLVAPTGIAAKRLAGVTGHSAHTIHRALGAKGIQDKEEREATYAGIIGDSTNEIGSDGSSQLWQYTDKDPHPAQVVIVDESSMVDQHLLYRLLSCTNKQCRIVFVGDDAQLPSVGPGNVLRDLIDSNLFPTVNLQEIYRQDEASDIVLAAHQIQRGETPTMDESSKDFILLESGSDTQTQELTIRTVRKLYENRTNFQVLSPRHKGLLGVTNLNLRVRDLLNPKSPGIREMRLGSETVREGDRIMVAKNNYKYEIYNGDVGKVVRLDPREKIVEIKIWGPPETHVRLPFKDAPSHLRMAYCVTVHKSQGQEYDTILLPWSDSFGRQLQRNLLYTAITRARKKVIIIGSRRAVSRAVANARQGLRNTLFADRLVEMLEFVEEPSASLGEKNS